MNARGQLERSPGQLHRRTMGAASALAALLLAGALSAPAAAAPGTGAVTLTTKGKAAKKLKRAGVRLSGARGASGEGRVTLPVTDVTVGPPAALTLAGELVFKGPGGGVSFSELQLEGDAITALSGGDRIRVFRAASSPAGSTGSLSLGPAKLRLLPKAAKQLRKRLDAKLRPGAVGTIVATAALSAQPDPPGPPTPAAGSCPTEPVSGGPPFTPPGTASPPAALPALASPQALVSGSGIDWGLRASFRGYVGNPGNPGYPAASTPPIMASGGSSTNPSGTFHWDGEGGYVRSTVPGEDQVVIQGGGSVQFCYPGHGFRITIANPAIVIDPDGSDGRIVLDVSSSLFGNDYPAQRVDFATLDLDGQRPAYSDEGALATWTGVPASLTADGSSAMAGFYPPGQALDPVTVTARTAAAPDPFADVCPIATATGDGPAVAEAAAPVAPLAGAVPVTAGGADWGFKDSFQTYIWNGFIPPPPAGTVSAINGATFDGASPFTAGDFGLPFAGGQYSDGGTPGDLADDSAVLETSGGGLFCRQSHSLRAAFGQVTVVLDGEGSRIVADADANLFGKTQGAQRVTLADLDTTGVVPTEAGGVVTWTGVPAALTQAGIDAFGFGNYSPGEAMEPITVSVDPQ